MPRGKRHKSQTGFYHVYNRGNNKMIIFECSNDYDMFLNLLKNKTQKYQIDICCYALMPNHFHIVLKDISSKLAPFMTSITTSYVRYFNAKYNRTGALFEGRYKLRCINNKVYLRTVIRYVLRNPEVANIQNVSTYKYTSYKEYFYTKEKYCNLELLKNLFPDPDYYRTYMSNRESDNKSLEIEQQDDDVIIERYIAIANNILHPYNCMSIQSLNINLRNESIRKLFENGISPYQIQKLTGISKSIVFKSLKNLN